MVNSRDNRVLAGNHTLAAALELGWEEIAATFVDVDDEQAARIVLVDNRSNDIAGYDDQALIDLLKELPDLEGTGYGADDLDSLIASLDTALPGEGGDTDPIEPPSEPRAQPGDMWALGQHRLLCGDATQRSEVERLFSLGPASAMWTDPPYGVDYVGKTAEALTIENDGEAGLQALLEATFEVADEFLVDGAPVYIAHPAGALSVVFAQAFMDRGWRFHQGLIWVKDSMVLGHADYHYRHEPILFGYTAGGGRRGRGGTGWFGDNAQTTVFEVPRPKASREHPTMKPVELIEQHLVNSTAPGNHVYEPFGGSGSTLIACENLGRVCLATEIDAAYCDVIVDRWERHTGGTAELLRDKELAAEVQTRGERA